MHFHHFAYRININKGHSHFEVTVPRVEIVGQYEMDGRILLLPISGKGDINLTLGKYLMEPSLVFSLLDNILIKFIQFIPSHTFGLRYILTL
jgi:hypothetical protein